MTMFSCSSGAGRFLILPVLLLTLTVARAEEAAVAYTNAVIETTGKAGRIEKGTVIVRGGKVEAVGKSVTIPDDARVIDARGKTIMPGIVDPFREVAMAGGSADAAPRTIIVGGRAITLQGRGAVGGGGFTRIADNFYPYDTGFRALLRSGLTSLNLVTPGYGQSAVVRVTPELPDAMLVNADGFLFTTVTNDSNSLDVVRTGLQMAELAKRGQPVVAPPVTQQAAPPATPPAGRRGGGGRRGGRGGMGGGFQGGGFSMASLKGWQAVYDGKAPLFASTNNAAAILHLLKLLEPYKDVQLVLIAPGPALFETVDQLAGKRIRVIMTPGLSLKPNTRDRVDVARTLHDAGLEFAFTQAANQVDLLAAQDFPLFSVAYLVRCGLPRTVALEALTARPAKLLGLDKTHGSIEPGKAADLLIFTGDPLDPASLLSQVLIEGRTVYEN